MIFIKSNNFILKCAALVEPHWCAGPSQTLIHKQICLPSTLVKLALLYWLHEILTLLLKLLRADTWALGLHLLESSTLLTFFFFFSGEIAWTFSEHQLHCTNILTLIKKKYKKKNCLSCFAIFQLVDYKSCKFLKAPPFHTKLVSANTILPALRKWPHQPVFLPMVQGTRAPSRAQTTMKPKKKTNQQQRGPCNLKWRHSWLPFWFKGFLHSLSTIL